MEKNVRILVVEDDLSLCDVLTQVFKDYEYVFQIHTDPHDIVGIAYRFKPDIILLDYLLPSTNGGALCGELKENHHTHSIPVIIYSALPASLLPINEYHCDLFIEKPFDIDFLVDKIESYASRSVAA